MKKNNSMRAVKLSDTYFVLFSESGDKLLRVTKILNGFYFNGSVDQQYVNSKGVSLEEFCKTNNRESLKKIAHYHKKDGVSKEKLHKGLDELASRKELDRYMHQRLKHMTRTCNCTAERLYYRLKNALGTERAHLVDGLNFRAENDSMKLSLNDFDLLNEALKAQGYKFIEEKTYGKDR